jgi:hypothetical protein
MRNLVFQFFCSRAKPMYINVYRTILNLHWNIYLWELSTWDHPFTLRNLQTVFFFLPAPPRKPYISVYCDEETGLGRTIHNIQIQCRVNAYLASLQTVLWWISAALLLYMGHRSYFTVCTMYLSCVGLLSSVWCFFSAETFTSCTVMFCCRFLILILHQTKVMWGDQKLLDCFLKPGLH